MSSVPHARTDGRARIWTVCVAVFLVLLLVLAAGTLLGIGPMRSWAGSRLGAPQPASSLAKCDVQTLEVVAAPDVSMAVRAGLQSLQDECLHIRVTPRPTAEVAKAVLDGGRIPAVWVPDSESWRLGFYLADVRSQIYTSALASTPVLLVGGRAARPAATWGAALGSPDLALPDPLATTTGALALVAPRAEEAALGRSSAASDELVVPLAQRYGERRANGQLPDLDLSTIKAGDPRVVPVTERTYLAALERNPGLRPVVPATGAPLMQFPLVLPEHPSDLAQRAALQLVEWMDSGEARAVLAEAGLRTGDGKTLRPVPGLRKNQAFLPTPEPEVFDDRLHSWRITSVPSSLLAVFDVSGSMDFPAGQGETRMDLSVGVATTALGLFPDHARIGLWAFSIDQGGRGQDWRVLEPIRRLDAPVDGDTQRDALLSQAQYMAQLTNGGTGLYDTTLAAYKQALKDYNPDYYNSVILLTDGANDDPGSISLQRLLGQLKGLRDKERPVRIIGVAISKDADLQSLSKIAQATGGKAYAASDPQDILGVFAQALLDR